MKILQVVQDFPPYNNAGVEIYTYNLSIELAKRHSVSIFHRANNVNVKEYKVDFKKHKKLNIYTINNTFKYCYDFDGLYKNSIIDKEFAKILDFIKPDVVHIQHLIFLSVNLIEEIKKRKIPIVLTLHDYWLICPQWHFLRKGLLPCKGDNKLKCIDCLDYQLRLSKESKKLYNLIRKFIPRIIVPIFQKVYVFLTRFKFKSYDLTTTVEKREENIRDLIKKIDIFIAPSNFIKDRFIKFGLSKNKIKLCQYGINNLQLFKDFKKTRSNKIRFGYIGTILPAKGLHILIQAFNKMQTSKAVLKVHGKLYYYRGFEYYPLYIKKMVKCNNIQFAGDFHHKFLSEIFSNIDVLIVPSIWYENSPFTIHEAFLFKTPVIASEIGGIPELIQNNINGFLFNPGNADDLADKIQFVIDNFSILEEIRKNIPKPKNISDNSSEMENIYLDLKRDSEKL